MKHDRLMFGIIGAGNIARLHADAISRIPGAGLMGVTAIPLDSAVKLAEPYGGIAYTDIDAMLSDERIDIITIATPSGLHPEQIVAAAQAGKHILVEKPLAISIDGADMAIDAARTSGVKLGVISQRRFDPAYVALKHSIDACDFGKIVLINGHVHYYREPSYFSTSNWRGTLKMDGGGALINQGIHEVDLVRWFGGPVSSVFARARTLSHDIEVEDVLTASLEFENGALGTLEATTSAYPGLYERIELMGDRGSVIIQDGKIVFWQTKNGHSPNLDACAGAIGNGSGDPMGISAAGHVSQFSDFIDAVREDRNPAIDGNDGRATLEIVCAAYESSRRKCLVDLPFSAAKGMY